MCVASDNHEADIVALIRSLGQGYKQCLVKATFLLALLQC